MGSRPRRALPSGLGALALALCCAACGATRHGEPWGARATLTPGFARTGEVLRDAALDPRVWVPLAGAAVIWAADWDPEISHWARSETPVFGSTNGAEQGSHDWRRYSQDLWLVSALATPSGDEPLPWVWNKAKGLAVQFAARSAAGELTSLGKDAFDRERPDHSDRRSMPSGHTTSAYASVTLAQRNVDALRLPAQVRVPIEVALDGVGALAAWARVEAGAHYPTDVLAGAALAAYVTRVVDELFLDPRGHVQATATLEPSGADGTGGARWSVGLAFRF